MGHDHPASAASREQLLAGLPEGGPGPAGGGGHPLRRASLSRSLALGLLVGAALGALEAALRLQGEASPSLARRAGWLVLQTGVLYGLAGAGATLALVPLSRLLGVRYAPAFERVLAGLACVLIGLAALGAARVAPAGAARPSGAPPPAVGGGPRLVLLVVVDTLRADALGAYGGPPTPTLDRLAARGTLFEEAVSPSSWTLPSMASLFTSRYPAEHGVVDFDGRLGARADDTLPGGDRSFEVHLAEVLADRGWATRAVVGNTLLDAEHGFDRFELYDSYDHRFESRLWLQRIGAELLQRLGLLEQRRRIPVPVLSPRWPFLDTRLAFYALDADLTDRTLSYALPAPSDRPLLLHVHYMAPHVPYLEHPLGLAKRFVVPPLEEHSGVDPAPLRASYDREVAYTDRELGRLLERLERDGLLEETLVCVTADHGEAFGEHGRFEHGHDLHREAVRVPLILAGPGVPAGRRVPGAVTLVDLAPTLLELVGVDAPDAFHGRSLVPALRGTDRPEGPVFAETSSKFLTPGARHSAAYDGTLRLLRVEPDGSESNVAGSEALYDVAGDPDEQRPLLAPAEGGPQAATLGQALDELARRAARPTEDGPAAPDLEAMRALGYAGEDDGVH